MKTQINLQNEIIVDNATQRTISVLGGKGSGKTTLIKMLLNQYSPVCCFDPLSVIDSKTIDAKRIILRTKDIDANRISIMMRVINKTLKKGDNVIFSFDNMIQQEEIELANLILPKLSLRHGFVFFDEVHEYVPIHSQSLETERYVRHCRNNDVGILMTSQRPASVHKNVLALTDYLILFRMTWTHDIKAVKDLLSDIIDKDEVREIISTLPKLDFMTGFVIDYRSSEK
jgi:DNA helicase HerA-like ATPase